MTKDVNVISETCVHVFVTDRSHGSRARVALLDPWPGESSLAETARQYSLNQSSDASESLVFAGINAEKQQGLTLPVRWYEHAREVDFCGSGALAAAQVLFEQMGFKPPLRLASRRRLLTIARHSVGVCFKVEGFHYQTADIPDFCQACFGAMPLRAATVGDENGYWVFQFAGDLLHLQPNFAQLSRATSRAVIATSRLSRGNCDYALRYFAPQYGIDEGWATGSANSIAAGYWHEVLQETAFRAIQYCVTGNAQSTEMLAEIDAGFVSIAGKAVISSAA